MGKENSEKKVQAVVNIIESEEIRKGCFSNTAQILHSTEDFRTDFYYISGDKGDLVARVAVTPGHMKRILKAMTENIKNYEEEFGQIRSYEKSVTFINDPI